jgi:uncharacterized protein YjbI with pentapeptide repeats
MGTNYIEEKSFTDINFAENELTGEEYENCKFSTCNFSSASVAGINFIDCEFNGCNFSLTDLNKTAMRDVAFIDCKVVGLHFDACKDFLFSVSFKNCVLNISSFYKLKLKKTIFASTKLEEVDFTEADLSGSVFSDCDLNKTIFDNTILQKVDFTTARNYSIDPGKNDIKKAKFSLPEVVGLLSNYDIEIKQ